MGAAPSAGATGAVGGSSAVPRRARSQRSLPAAAALALVGILAWASLSPSAPLRTASVSSAEQPSPAAAARTAPNQGPLLKALGEALVQVEELQKEVDQGHAVAGFGERAQGIIAGSAPELEKAIDAAL